MALADGAILPRSPWVTLTAPVDAITHDVLVTPRVQPPHLCPLNSSPPQGICAAPRPAPCFLSCDGNPLCGLHVPPPPRPARPVPPQPACHPPSAACMSRPPCPSLCSHYPGVLQTWFSLPQMPTQLTELPLSFTPLAKVPSSEEASLTVLPPQHKSDRLPFLTGLWTRFSESCWCVRRQPCHEPVSEASPGPRSYICL